MSLAQMTWAPASIAPMSKPPAPEKTEAESSVVDNDKYSIPDQNGFPHPNDIFGYIPSVYLSRYLMSNLYSGLGDFVNGMFMGNDGTTGDLVTKGISAFQSLPWLVNNIIHENTYGLLGDSSFTNYNTLANEQRAIKDLGHQVFSQEKLNNLKPGEVISQAIDKDAMNKYLGLNYRVGLYGTGQSMGSKALATQLGQYRLSAINDGGQIKFIVDDDYDFSNTGTISDAIKSNNIISTIENAFFIL